MFATIRNTVGKDKRKSRILEWDYIECLIRTKQRMKLFALFVLQIHYLQETGISLMCCIL